MRYVGFEPFYRPDSRLLVLGSFPGVVSRKDGFYYGNPRNRFWRVLSEAAGQPQPVSAAGKRRLLEVCRVALWDVVASCEIEGSLDKNIRAYEIADIPWLLRACPIEKIALNGGTAHILFIRHFPALAPLAEKLPSTSPAHTKFDPAPWRALFGKYL